MYAQQDKEIAEKILKITTTNKGWNESLWRTLKPLSKNSAFALSILYLIDGTNNNAYVIEKIAKDIVKDHFVESLD